MSLDPAVREWRQALGEEHVVTDETALGVARRATFATRARIPAVIRPASVSEVQECVRVASRHGVAVHPVSTGRNWGFGSRVPDRDGSVLMELARMTAIRDHNEELAYVRIEPGVTFRGLAEFLERQGSRLVVPFTGSSPETSVIGNTLERGFGVGRLGYRTDAVCSIEVVLANGECVTTGLSSFPGAAINTAYRGGPGPELDGLFFQSNLGIVTAMTVWLAPRASDAQLCYFGIRDAARLPALVDGVRELLLHGVLTPIVTVRNDYSLLLTSGRRYPWRALRERTPFPPEVLERGRRLRDRDAWWSAAWAGVAWLHGASGDHLAALRSVVERRLGEPADRLVFAGSPGVRVSAWEDGGDREAVAEAFREVGAARIAPGAGHSNLAEAYWRKRGPLPDDLDPDRDGCGVLFCTPIVPLRGADVARCAAVLSDTALAHGFEPVLNTVVIQERAAYLSAMIVFDRETDGEDERALACHEAMLDATAKIGYVEHRAAIPSETIRRRDPASAALLSNLKRALDPSGILAPGRYID